MSLTVSFISTMLSLRMQCLLENRHRRLFLIEIVDTLTVADTRLPCLLHLNTIKNRKTTKYEKNRFISYFIIISNKIMVVVPKNDD